MQALTPTVTVTGLGYRRLTRLREDAAAVPATSSADIPVISTPRRSPSLDVVDAQIHVRGEPGLAIAAMDAVGVEAAVVDIYPPDTQVDDDGITRYDLRLAQTAIERFPGRFAYMGHVDPADPDLDEIMKRFAETQASCAFAPATGRPWRRDVTPPCWARPVGSGSQ